MESPYSMFASSPIIERQIRVTLLGKLIHYFREIVVKFFRVKNDTNHLMKKAIIPSTSSVEEALG